MSNSPQKRIVLPRSERTAPANATRISTADAQRVITVSVIVRRRNPLDIGVLGGRIVSREEFDRQYAADPADFEALRSFAHRHGLSVDESASSLSRRTLVLRGTVQAMQAAFGVELHDYEEPRTRRRFHTFTGQISMPEEHAGRVETVLGLDARPVARAQFRVLNPAQQAQAQSFNPPQVAQLYNYPKGVNGAGETIGIIELGGGYDANDLDTYFPGLGLATPTVIAVSVDGGSNAPGDPNGADGEVELDIQVAGAIANGARIVVYFAPNTDQGFIDAITTAVHDTANKPSVISISWGGPESSWSDSSRTALDNACQSAAALGVTITVAAGDNGSSDGASGNNVDFPASSPHVLACGGTKLQGSGSAITSEVVWNDGSQGGATGGGFSADFAVPTWQQGIAGFSGKGRGVPDVAGDAAPETGYNILVDGQQQVVGGTSAVAPLWAALIALVNQQKGSPVGFVNPNLYANAGTFRDITQGSNGAYSAGPGWDACTGLGSPNGQKISQALAGRG